MWKTELLDIPVTLTFHDFLGMSSCVVYLSSPYGLLIYTSLLGLLFPVYPSKLVAPSPSVFLHREDPLFQGPSL
ncbi:hypothetical protein E2C01_072349 [Portunus trituberculatus]|uniref:Uncharacterized protein n=1 Tax=Portunus trituberculatus TaxID=210409 RepID=A0A5B7HXQ9_PORTR|nr:hypothetical protein [Portunus trituberculatus]